MSIELVIFLISIACCIAITFFMASLWYGSVKNSRLSHLYVLYVIAFFWILFDGITVIAAEQHFRMFFILRMTFVSLLPYAMLRYFLHNAEISIAKSLGIKILLFSLELAELIFLWTNPLHNLIFADYNYPKPTDGQFFYFHLGTSSFVLLCAFTLLIVCIIKNIKRNPVIAWAAPLMLLPIVLNIVYTVDLLPLEFDMIPLSFVPVLAFLWHYSQKSKLGNENNCVRSATLK